MLRPWQRRLTLLGLLALIPSWLGLFGGWHWLLDLCSHFRWQYLLASFAVAIWALALRQRRTAIAALLTLLLNAALIGQLAWHPELARAVRAEDFGLSVLTLNVLAENPDKAAVLRHVRDADADIVVLEEVDPGWLRGLAELETKYPHRLLDPRPGHFGMALYSRIAFQAEEVWSLSRARGPTLAVKLQHQGRALWVVGVHPMSPGGGRYTAMRDAYLAALAQRVAELPEPVLVVGDFNATPWSAGMRIATSANLAFRSLTPPWEPTWRARSPLAVPIDHALCTAPLLITSRDVGPYVGSDHRGVRFTVEWGV